MDDDMDIDLVLEEEDAEIAQLRVQAQEMHERAQAADAEFETMNGVENVPEDGEVDSSAAVPTKIHMRGLDSLTTADIKAFVKEHYADDLLKRVEWIDDTSANIIFDNAEAASEALEALSVETLADRLQTRPAKQLSTHPNTEIEIRQTIAADVKLPGAKDRSRFYLLNPEYDPDMRLTNRKRRYGEEGNRSSKRRRNDHEQNDRRGSDTGPAFNVDFYDDSTAAPSAEDTASKRAQMEDLFKNRKVNIITQQRASRNKDGRLKERSASPAQDGNGKYGFEEEQPYRRTARHRSLTPPHLRKARKRELGKEDVNREKELFPDKNGPAHKRSDAQNLHPDDIADIIGDEKKSRSTGKGDLFSRISTGGVRNHGRLNGSSTSTSNRVEHEGFSILGAAKDRPENPLVKELFPLKNSGANGKKELFDGKIKGRAVQRRRAEDLF